MPCLSGDNRNAKITFDSNNWRYIILAVGFLWRCGMNKTVSILKILIGFFVLAVFLNPVSASEKPEHPVKPENIVKPSKHQTPIW